MRSRAEIALAMGGFLEGSAMPGGRVAFKPKVVADDYGVRSKYSPKECDRARVRAAKARGLL